MLREMWENKTWPDEPLGPGWTDAFVDWIGEFGLARVADAVQMACKPRFSEDGERLPPDIGDVPRYAAVERAEDREPGMKACYLVRGRMRLKFYSSEDDDEILKLLKRVMRPGVAEHSMNDAVDETDTLEDCFAAMGVDRAEFRIAMGHPIVDFGLNGKVFVRTEDPEWRIWDAYLCRTTGKGAPISRRGGWYFPSRLPPADAVPKKAKR
ncbi:hypothetical protein [Bradyrhizobium sp. DASA03120]|uniref:hypothetical protein n=1 Tax=Bradyrhizobium sp. SMVTL-02 TaxID=3395917 RepID=UPI003F71D0FC